MNDPQDNPYASPSQPGKSRRRKRWSVGVRLLCWSLGSLALSMASIAAGLLHYHQLSQAFDTRLQDSRELARLTEPAGYWLIPALGFLAISLIVGIVALVVVASKLARRR
ncbi:hypothetical protein [Aeoliella sp. SH292]|uniref:hypothetical protein n=1 Tax=Aeoliella sp. SH292 TaxID=3454464 RepID=UPI003F9AE28A